MKKQLRTPPEYMVECGDLATVSARRVVGIWVPRVQLRRVEEGLRLDLTEDGGFCLVESAVSLWVGSAFYSVVVQHPLKGVEVVVVPRGGGRVLTWCASPVGKSAGCTVSTLVAWE